jgi:hypothetical protein
MKHYFSTLIFSIFVITAFSQTDCQATFTSGDVYRWRGELNFIPKSMTIERFNYIINNFSDKAYNQMRIEISVTCHDDKSKNDFVENMKYYWDNKISASTLETYFPAFYIFYQIDKSGKRSDYPSEPKYKKNSNEDGPANSDGKSSYEKLEFYLNQIFYRDIIDHSERDIRSAFFDKTISTLRSKPGEKRIYWEVDDLSVSFTFDDMDRCIYYNILPHSNQARENIIRFLDQFKRLSTVKWYSSEFNYYVQLILDQHDYFVCFKDLKKVN